MGDAGVFPLNLYARVRNYSINLHTRPRVQRAPGIPRTLFSRVNLSSLGRIAPREGEGVRKAIVLFHSQSAPPVAG